MKKLFLIISLFFIIINCFSQVIKDLPTTEFPSEGGPDYFVVLITGDGGWRELDREVTAYMNSQQIPVVALNSMTYFKEEKLPPVIAGDVQHLMDEYGEKWQKKEVVLLGYSMGAEVMPFAVNAMDNDHKQKIKDMILIAPWQNAIFDLDWFDYIYSTRGGQSIKDELILLKPPKAYCICDDKKISLCKTDLDGVIDHCTLEGGHHFGHDYSRLCELIGNRLNIK